MPFATQWFPRIILCLILAGAAFLLAWLAAGIPIHFKAVAPAVLQAAGRGSTQTAELARDALATGRIGVARLLWELPESPPPSEPDRARARQLLETFPLYHLSGGPDPFFEQYLAFLPASLSPQNLHSNPPLLQLLLPRQHRQELVGFLENSSHHAVLQILDMRQWTLWSQFMPVDSPAGHPLDASLLTMALLLQGNSLTRDLRLQWQELADAAAAGDTRAAEALEQWLSGLLSLANRLGWGPLTELAGLWTDLDQANAFLRHFQQYASQWQTLWGSLVLTADLPALNRYLDLAGENAMAGLRYSLPLGRGALEALFAAQKPLYEPPHIVQWMDRHLGTWRYGSIATFSFRFPGLALAAKLLTLLCCGLALCLAAGVLLRPATRVVPRSGARSFTALMAAYGFGAVALASVLALLLEPALASFGEQRNSQLSLEFVVNEALQSLTSQSIKPTMIDQVTIIVLLLFFFIQLVVYTFGLLKLGDIRRQQLPAAIKLTLLDNEDNLFDLGLYVGLSGTVLSLILLAMDIVQASLIAAYASTLFGIIFTAILKILHVRPQRRRLILEAQGLLPKGTGTSAKTQPFFE